MNDFKEWLSDNLRYFIVGVVVILIIGGSILGIRLYSSAVNGDDKIARISTETELKETNKKETEKKETEKKETEKKETEKKETEKKKDTEKETEEETNKQSESTKENTENLNQGGNSSDSESNSGFDGTDSASVSGQGDAAQPDVIEIQEPETVQPEPSQPVYMTLNGACYMRSYPDYGDNIIGQYEAGTTVQFLADVGGWYEVSIDGVTGYVGARFCN